MKTTLLASRVLVASGSVLTAVGAGGAVALRAFGDASGPDALAAWGRGVVLASLTLILLLAAAVGLALVVAGVTLGIESRPARAARREYRAPPKAVAPPEE